MWLSSKLVPWLSNKGGKHKVICLKILNFDVSVSTKLLFCECKCFLNSSAHFHLHGSLAYHGDRYGLQVQHGQPMAQRLYSAQQDSVWPTASAQPSSPTFRCEQDLVRRLDAWEWSVSSLADRSPGGATAPLLTHAQHVSISTMW